MTGNAFYAPVDADLVRGAQRGEASALATLYERFQRPAYNLSLRVLGDGQAAEDVVHDVFVRLMERIRGFRGDAPFGAWLRRLVANATIDELRRRQWLSADPPPETVAGAVELDGLPEKQVEAWQMLMRLSPRARAVLVLHALEGYTHRELAEMFGQSESYSKSILARALQKLATGDDHPPLEKAV